MNDSVLSSVDDLSIGGKISPFISGLNSQNNSKSSFSNTITSTVNTNLTTNTTIYHQVEIRPRDSFKFFVRAAEPLETLHFSFYTRKKSIGFGLFYLYLPNLWNEQSESVNMNVSEEGVGKEKMSRTESFKVRDLPLDKVKELIGESRENVRLHKIGQEGSLARTLSTGITALNTKYLTVEGLKSRSVSNENLSVYEGGNASETTSSSLPLQNQRKLKIGELIEIIPIKKFNSFEYTLQGSYTIPLTGTYVLLFDNSFSIGTSKHLFYHAYLSTDIVPTPTTTPQLLSSGQMGSLCAAGWLSKRRTGMLRSWARRWFQLDSLGVLSYFEDRASPLRGSIFVPDCSLIIAKASLRFSLDSGSQTFHLQAYRKDEFDFWIQVFSSFKHFGPPTTLTSSHQLPTKTKVIENGNGTTTGIKSKLDDAFKFVRARLDSIRTKQPQQLDINDTIVNLESLYELLQRTREAMDEELGNDLQAYQDGRDRDRDRDEETDDYDEIFYDVEEIYVDQIDTDDDQITMRTFRSDESDLTGSDVNENYNYHENENENDFDDDDDAIYSDIDATDDENEVFEPVIEFDEELFKIKKKSIVLVTSPSISEINAERNRNITEWLLRGDITLPRDHDMTTNKSIYRNCLPFPAPPINISFASVIMRKSFPVALNEPINLLQRLAEELEYSELLDRAANLNNDPVEQMIQIAAFAVSGYASSIHRSERKPYNPVLGETYEYIRPDRGFRFIAEKVSHQPVIVACFAESVKWKFWQDVQAETKLWGKSMLINPKGKLHLSILDESTGEIKNVFTWNKVSGALRNVYSSKKNIENYGELVIRSKSSDLVARISFKESGMFSNSGNEIEGGVYETKTGNILAKLTGRWDDMICKEVQIPNNGNLSISNNNNNNNNNTSSNLLQVIWKTNPLPSNYAQFFCLTSYGVTLNDLPELLKKVLPLTDSRYRPDQRMLESGMIDAADSEKQRIEQIQRNRRNTGEVVEPTWFTFDKATDSWKFNEKYWIERENGFKGVKMLKLW